MLKPIFPALLLAGLSLLGTPAARAAATEPTPEAPVPAARVSAAPAGEPEAPAARERASRRPSTRRTEASESTSRHRPRTRHEEPVAPRTRVTAPASDEPVAEPPAPQAGVRGEPPAAARSDTPAGAPARDETLGVPVQEVPAPVSPAAKPAAEGLSTSQAVARVMAEAAPQKAGSTSSAPQKDLTLWSVLNLLLRLAIVLVIAYGAVLVLRRMNAGRLAPQSGRLRVVETVALGQGRSLHIVSVGGRLLLVSATSQQVSLLKDVTEDLGEEAGRAGSPAAPAAGTFTQRLLEVMQRSNPPAGDQNGARRGNP